MVWTDGTRYVGEWCHGIQHGKGQMVMADGTVKEGLFDCNVYKGPLEPEITEQMVQNALKTHSSTSNNFERHSTKQYQPNSRQLPQLYNTKSTQQHQNQSISPNHSHYTTVSKTFHRHPFGPPTPIQEEKEQQSSMRNQMNTTHSKQFTDQSSRDNDTKTNATIILVEMMSRQPSDMHSKSFIHQQKQRQFITNNRAALTRDKSFETERKDRFVFNPSDNNQGGILLTANNQAIVKLAAQLAQKQQQQRESGILQGIYASGSEISNHNPAGRSSINVMSPPSSSLISGAESAAKKSNVIILMAGGAISNQDKQKQQYLDLSTIQKNQNSSRTPQIQQRFSSLKQMGQRASQAIKQVRQSHASPQQLLKFLNTDINNQQIIEEEPRATLPQLKKQYQNSPQNNSSSVKTTTSQRGNKFVSLKQINQPSSHYVQMLRENIKANKDQMVELLRKRHLEQQKAYMQLQQNASSVIIGSSRQLPQIL
ncbi:hypothetical protein FGO68_gene1833 [Halteria grandinella]|uniref:Uncharacterized protein n=1 Tax=Halteria grandinella TaxID=5974 RepID=A0A8J8NDH4_HALGN|nr:hypothetical protein FGO68_gene1833 [Halteria grandinella]